MLLTGLPVENSNVKTEGGPTQFNQNPDKKVKYEKLNLFLRLIFPKWASLMQSAFESITPPRLTEPIKILSPW